MSKQRRCIRITSTRTGKLRARVEIAPKVGSPEVGLGSPGIERFEVTLGGERWDSLDIELQEAIILRARRYVDHLIAQLNEHAPPIHIGKALMRDHMRKGGDPATFKA